MKKRMHKFFAALVALIMLCGAVPLAAHAEEWPPAGSGTGPIAPPANAVPIVLNTDTVINFTVADEVRYVSFTPGKTGMYHLFSRGGLSASCSLHTADGGGIGGFSTFLEKYELTAGETYYFKVKLSDPDVTGSLTVHLKDNAEAWPPRTVAMWTDLDGEEINITAAGEVQYVSFTPGKTGRYRIHPSGDPARPKIVCNLYAADGEKLQSGGTANVDFLVEAILTIGTTYYFEVKLQDPDATGSFSVYLWEHMSEWPRMDAVPIELYTDTAVDVAAAGEVRCFSLPQSRSGKYYVEISAAQNVVCNLYSEHGELLGQGTAGGTNQNSIIELNTNSGWLYGRVYYLELKLQDPNATGSFSVYLRDLEYAEVRLNRVLKEAKETKRLWISADKWLALKKAIQTAQAVADDPNSTEAQKEAQIVVLKQAIDAATDFRENEFNYKLGNFWRLFFGKSWNGYWGVELISNLIQFPFALIWVPIHFLMIGVSWVVGWFI